MADQFCLRWNNFQTNIVNALDSLKCSEDLVDVTLTCEGKNIKAHKVILSACSPYFRNVFKENPCQHPVIILKDVSSDDIVSLLSYMYQGEVFIEESKLSSFLHTAALLQVKGLTGVTNQRENFSSPNPANKLYTQLTISPKPQFCSQKDNRLPGLKKRRSSTSDKPNDITIGNAQKRNRILDSNDLYNNLPNLFKEVTSENNNIEKKNDNIVPELVAATVNGKNNVQTINHASENIPTVKIEIEEHEVLQPAVIPPLTNSENNTDAVPDYENSMLARSLLSGINPLKNELSANNNTTKKVIAKTDGLPTSRPKENNDTNLSSASNSPPKVTDEPIVKSEKMSPDSDNEYEPEVLLSEQNDGNDSDDNSESQTLMYLAGMQGVLPGASTSGVVHQHAQIAANHAAICGDCPHCGMKYSNQSALKYHVRLMHSDLTNRLCCYLCPRSFTMRETFKEHMWSTHGQRN